MIPCRRLGALLRFVPYEVRQWAEGASATVRHLRAGAPVLETHLHNNPSVVTLFWQMAKGLSSREVIRKLTADGWVHVRTNGSHHQYRHPTTPGTVTVPHPKKDLGVGVLKSIERQSGLKLR